MAKQVKLLDAQNLRNRLRLKSLASERKLLESHDEAGKFFQKYSLRPGKIRAHAVNLLTSGALAGTLLLSSPPSLPTTQVTPHTLSITVPQELRQSVTEMVALALPKEITPLTPGQENKISKILKETFGLDAYASFQGNKLLQSYGRMGAEQHLPRFPGDRAELHNDLVEKGITPGLGGWGYVTDPQIEKYYVAVQTLYLPNWKIDTRRLSRWYKFRRVVVVNPANGKTVVAAVADAGPAQWTGKHFGGSPEVMKYLNIDYGKQNHPVVLFFLDDKNEEIPLGPVEYNKEVGNPALVNKA